MMEVKAHVRWRFALRVHDDADADTLAILANQVIAALQAAYPGVAMVHLAQHPHADGTITLVAYAT